VTVTVVSDLAAVGALRRSWVLRFSRALSRAVCVKQTKMVVSPCTSNDFFSAPKLFETSQNNLLIFTR